MSPWGFLPVTWVESETETEKVAKQPRTRQHPKNKKSDEADGDEPQCDSEEYHYDGYRKLRVEALGFYLTPEAVEHLTERTDLEPIKTLTAVEQDPSAIAKAFRLSQLGLVTWTYPILKKMTFLILKRGTQSLDRNLETYLRRIWIMSVLLLSLLRKGMKTQVLWTGLKSRLKDTD